MTDAEKREKLLAAVKADDVKAFGSEMSSEVFSMCFGRFPLLSLLYLFNAKKIVKTYYTELIKERPRKSEMPDREADDRFASLAGKALRYFTDREVSPLEMLAVLGRGKALKSLYAVYPNAEKYLPFIQKVYFTRMGEGVVVTGRTLTVPKERISYADRRRMSILAWISLTIGVAFTVITVFLSVWFGLGNKTVFYKARSGGEVLSAVVHDQALYLKKDVTLSYGAEESSSLIEGNDHVISLSEPFLQSFSGEMRNVTFRLASGFKGDAVIPSNSGTLVNVRVIAEDLSLEKGGENQGLLTAVNLGVIEDCSVTLSVTIEGEANGEDGTIGDCYFAPFAGKNEGTIRRCLAEGSITARNVDVAGVAGQNAKAGVIEDCSVALALFESTDLKGWTPNVAGVTDGNEGKITGCTVRGAVTSLLAAPEPGENEGIGSAYAAGVACTNAGDIENCVSYAAVTANAGYGAAFAGGIVTLNGYTRDRTIYVGTAVQCLSKGEVNATSSAYNAYAGGIAAQNEQGSTISSCGQSAFVSAKSEKESYYDFTGGIAGSNSGSVKNSFFTGTLANHDAVSLIGGICGLVYLHSNFYGPYINMDKNFFTAENVSASGGVNAEQMYHYLYPNTIFGAAFFEDEERLSAYVSEIIAAYEAQYADMDEITRQFFGIGKLDAEEVKETISSDAEQLLNFGGSKVTLDQLKAMEVYYE